MHKNALAYSAATSLTTKPSFFKRRLQEEVRRFAVDHTFKETAKKFGIHHSTVSGWVKAGEQVTSLDNFLVGNAAK
jgi:hypothetical protein